MRTQTLGIVDAPVQDRGSVAKETSIKATGPGSLTGAPVGSRPARLGEYEVLRHLATGGMAELYLGRKRAIEGFEKLVVLKRILPALSRDREIVELFLQEARLAATLHHPNIVQVYDVARAGDDYFLAMEFVHGRDLRQLLDSASRAGRSVPLEIAVAILIAVCAAVHHAHEQVGLDGRALGIIHRDVSPSNVLVSYDGAVKIADFGIAKAKGRSVDTRTGQVRGKVSYLSPEQCECRPLDRRSDVFALAILLYELSTNRRAYAGSSEFETMRRIVEGPAPRPSSVSPSYPRALEAIVLRGLARAPEERYATARQMQRALEELARDLRMDTSPVNIERFVHELFATDLAGWRAAQRAGRPCVDHRVGSGGATGDPAVEASGRTRRLEPLGAVSRPVPLRSRAAALLAALALALMGLALGLVVLRGRSPSGPHAPTVGAALPAAGPQDLGAPPAPSPPLAAPPPSPPPTALQPVEPAVSATSRREPGARRIHLRRERGQPRPEPSSPRWDPDAPALPP
jgi:serine/threonine protein kinase